MRWTVKVPGSCGELVQGTHGGTPYLVTCPINLYTYVTISDEFQGLNGLGVKSQAALRRTLDYLGEKNLPYGIKLHSELPISKGMASSSADIAAVSFAVSAACGKKITAPEVSRIAAGIEPTDGVFFPKIVRLNQMTGECFETLADFPALKIAVFDTGGTIDTVTFHRRTDIDELARRNEERTDKAMEKIRRSAHAVDWAAAATESALANQKILPKENLSDIIEAAMGMGAIGVNVAHSGTVVGVLFAPEVPGEKVQEVAARLANKFSPFGYLESVELVSGGYELAIGS